MRSPGSKAHRPGRATYPRASHRESEPTDPRPPCSRSRDSRSCARDRRSRRRGRDARPHAHQSGARSSKDAPHSRKRRIAAAASSIDGCCRPTSGEGPPIPRPSASALSTCADVAHGRLRLRSLDELQLLHQGGASVLRLPPLVPFRPRFEQHRSGEAVGLLLCRPGEMHERKFRRVAESNEDIVAV
jgi:hypothetical protein